MGQSHVALQEAIIRTLLLIPFYFLSICYAEPVEVPYGTADWNAFHFLGFNENGIAVRELRKSNLVDETQDTCVYPQTDTLLKGRPAVEVQEGAGVVLHAWPLPKVGEVVVIRPKYSFEIYKGHWNKKGCTNDADAKKSLTQAKAAWKNQGLTWEDKMLYGYLFQETTDKFKGKCFTTRQDKNGCDFSREVLIAGNKVKLALNLKSNSDSDVADGEVTDDDVAHGTRVKNHYTGSVQYKGKKLPFDLFVPNMHSNSTMQRLGSAHIYTNNKITVVVFYFSWVFLSEREKVPVVLRLE